MPRTIDYLDEPLELDDYEERHRPANQRQVRGVPVDPLLRETFEITPHDERDPLEIEDWWNRPFIVSHQSDEGVRYDVRCLDGGAWDRSTWRGTYESLDAAVDSAIALSEAPQQMWRVTELKGRVLYEGTLSQCEEWVAGSRISEAVVFTPVERE